METLQRTKISKPLLDSPISLRQILPTLVSAQVFISEAHRLHQDEATVTFPIVEWQALDVDTGRDSSFYNFCDTLEIKAGAIAPATGFGAQSALASWATFYRTGYLDDCEYLSSRQVLNFTLTRVLDQMQCVKDILGMNVFASTGLLVLL